MQQLTTIQSLATSRDAVQNQNEPQLLDENAHNDKYTHSLHDALPISNEASPEKQHKWVYLFEEGSGDNKPLLDRKSTRLNSSHLGISYAVFCLKKKIGIYVRNYENKK